jgi:hypothetical protein
MTAEKLYLSAVSRYYRSLHMKPLLNVMDTLPRHFVHEHVEEAALFEWCCKIGFAEDYAWAASSAPMWN